MPFPNHSGSYAPLDNAVTRVIEKAAEFHGKPGAGVACLARDLGVSKIAVQQFHRNGFLPPRRAIQVGELYGIEDTLSLVHPKLRGLSSATN